MNTSVESSPEVKASGILTEAEVIAWLRSRAESYGIITKTNSNMNTSVESSPEVKASGILTEAEVIAWLRSRAESYGIKGLSFDISCGPNSPVTARVPKAGSSWDVHYGFAATIDEAVEKVRAEIKTPEEIAAKLRAEAAKLIAEADAILALPAPAETAEKVEVAA